ncbi:hypothetical protein OH77DRAFT_202180 [Trametes cingulata]|nr:hypothetical protein OH77DRAFT_202180 [Trametes cingulata]
MSADGASREGDRKALASRDVRWAEALRFGKKRRDQNRNTQAEEMRTGSGWTSSVARQPHSRPLPPHLSAPARLSCGGVQRTPICTGCDVSSARASRSPSRTSVVGSCSGSGSALGNGSSTVCVQQLEQSIHAAAAYNVQPQRTRTIYIHTTEPT